MESGEFRGLEFLNRNELELGFVLDEKHVLSTSKAVGHFHELDYYFNVDIYSQVNSLR